MGRPTVLSGARAIITINNNLVVYALSVSYSVETSIVEIQGIDNLLPEELAPNKLRVTCTCISLRVPKASAQALKIQPTILNGLEQSYCSIEIKDRQTNATILYVPRAMCTQVSGSVRSRALSAEEWTFVGIGFWNEVPPTESKPRS